MKKPSLLCTRLGAALLTVCLLLGMLPIASAASAAPRAPVAADGRILYVAPNGSDANPGSYAEPFATLEAAMNAMSPGTCFMSAAACTVLREPGAESPKKRGQSINGSQF